MNVDLRTASCPHCGNRDVEVLNGIVCCTACEDGVQEAWSRRQHRQLLATAIAEMKAAGLLTDDALRTKFKTHARIPEGNQPAWDKARTWADGSLNAYIHGPFGTGKTTLAQCLLTSAIESIYYVGACKGYDIAGLRRHDPEGIQRLSRPRVLLIDDLDKADWTRSAIANLFVLLDRRATKRTIVTANVSPDRLGLLLNQMAGTTANESMVGAALDRLYTGGGAPMIIELRGDSLRGRIT